MIASTLQAMRRIEYDGQVDVWILDEGDDQRVRRLAEQVGAHHFSRKGRPEFNQPSGAFKAMTKAGNHNAWRAKHEGEYDVVPQMDPDHRPLLDFLTGPSATSGIPMSRSFSPPSLRQRRGVVRGGGGRRPVLPVPRCHPARGQWLRRAQADSPWIGDFFRFVANHPEVNGFVWVEAAREADWRITSSKAATAAFAGGVGDPRYGPAMLSVRSPARE